MTSTIELALFKLKPQVSEAEFASALSATNEWLARQPGFILRRHGCREGGERMDYLEWESMVHAKVAMEKFPDAPEMRSFLDAIEPESISVRHFAMV